MPSGAKYLDNSSVCLGIAGRTIECENMEKTMEKTFKIGFMALVLSAIVNCGTADIRTDKIKNGVSASNERKALDIYAKVIEAHGGQEAHTKLRKGTFLFKDTWHGTLTKWVWMEWDDNGASYRMNFDPQKFGNTSIEFLEGDERGKVWGTHNEKFYIIPAGEETKNFDDDIDKRIFNDTLEYMAILPFHIQNADKWAYVDDVQENSQNYHRIMASWGTLEPQANFDQWILYVNKANYRIDAVLFTVRDAANFIKAVYLLKDYKKINGVYLPHKMDALLGTDLDASSVHTFEIRDAAFTTKSQ